MTSSIFATTLLASFVVVGLPHMLPCPAPRVAYAEGQLGPDGKRRRRRKCVAEVATDGLVKNVEEVSISSEGEEVEEVNGKRERGECPIPKPGGVVGEILGFKKTASCSEADTTVVRPP
jgi:cytochrome c oxidase assembly factor 2